MDEQNRIADDEAKERSFLLGKYRNLEHEVDLLREQLEEEHQAKADSGRQLQKANGEVQVGEGNDLFTENDDED